VWGLLRGSVYLPVDFTDLDNPQHNRTVMVHELSHIIRYDAAINLIQILVQAIFWFHPVVWWVNRKIRQEREKCCDEMVVAQFSTAPEHYTNAIVDALTAERRSAHPVPSLAIVGSVKDIEERIKTMLRPGKKFYKRPSVIALIIILLFAFFIVPIGCVLTNKSETKTVTEQKENTSKSLFESIWDSDPDEVKRLIANGVDVNATDPDNQGVKYTPLMAAANGGFAKVAKVLLENGAEVNATDFQGWTALYYAFWIYSYDDNEKKHRERAELVKALIASGADVNKKNQGISPLINAITTGTPRLGSIEALLDGGADLHFKDNRGLTPLYYATFMGDRDVLDLIIERGGYADTIHLAACRGDIDRVRTLLEKGTDVNTKDEFDCTPLHWAARARSPEVASLLISNGADINVTAGPDNLTPFMAARQLPIIEVLISKGADIRSRENLGKLHEACSAGDIKLVRFLIDKGADINTRNGPGATPLWAAAMSDQKEIVELLLDEGADINAPGRRGSTPLWITVRNYCEETAKFLIEKGANINTPDDRGVTPLDVAEQRGSADMVELLQQHGARKGSPNLLGIINSSDIEQVKLLISQGVDINVKNNNGLTALHLVARGGRKDVVELLIDNGADVNNKTNNGMTPLHQASRNGLKEIVELLISRGADINVKNTRGQTPLDMAQQRGHTEIVELLRKHGSKE
jgi:ankyrin repeat protein